MSKRNDSSDPNFHYEIWKGAASVFGGGRKSIYYVENHNASCGYAELALDFSYAAELLLEQYRKTGFGNWMAPVAHISRQLIELRLKALMTSIKTLDVAFDANSLRGHDLNSIWMACRIWLVNRGYKIQEDIRLDVADHFVLAFHEIDPSGDLFRFGISRKTAFDRKKSYDRVGIEVDLFAPELKSTDEFLTHWEAVVFRENMKREMGWSQDPYFDPDNFPRKK